MKTLFVSLPAIFCAGTCFGQNTVDCTPDRVTQIAAAQSTIAGKIDGALNFVSQNPLYERWFGTFDANRAATVRANLEVIKSHALISQPEYTCVPTGQGACSPGTLAYIESGTSFEISLCDAFFGLASHGTDTQWGTILHEMSHFHLGPGTEDECYGSDGIGACVDLAISDPDAAITNADNYQYFVEQSPI